ncbi:DNA (cytosine-5)-methyltransferase DRM2 isoform X2 [Cryptomeria japonica]|uniref:DNA (cytosine-5)-methyltransferase DRM2 isoform X2 n=1 Tax=Cryptomeria japonica TaxID=3369 RepID=UPI0027D9E24C|nr:DNA (cytosine-5)-methyltransferase DRM2 isoform X2 [Cryptomeria japonica]
MGNLVEYEESDTEEALKKNAGQPIKLSGDQDNGKKISEELEECASTIIWQDFSHNACEGSSSNASWSSIKRWFVDMGCSSTIVDKAIDIYGTKNEDDILEYVLACQAADYSSDSSHQDSFTDLERLEWEDTYNFGENEVKSQPQFSEFAHLKEAQPEDFKADIIMAQLMEMGYSENEISAAIQINGVHTHIHELVDFIHAYMQETEIGKNVVNVVLENYKDKGKKKQNGEVCRSKFRKRKKEDIIISSMETDSTLVHKRLMGFGVPGFPAKGRSKQLKEFMQGPPFFYFENVAIAPKDVWKTVSRHFDGVEVEFVDSKYFSASKRPRGYVHNLPIEGRSQLLPLPPMTIDEAFPQTKKYWPSWDHREKLNCICGSRASDVQCQELRSIIKRSHGKPSLSEQAYILHLCKKNNLIWVGPDQMAPLEPHEIELVLGFGKDHTRGVSSMTERLQCLGNAFQIDTVAYHLSVLKPFYPSGIKVLSLFSGIGGAEVALHRIGISLKCVVSVEICPKNRLTLSSWWKKTQQTGTLIEKEDVQDLTREVLEEVIDRVGGFDLIVGGSPCNNLSGNNRVSRNGLEGKQSSIFYEFPRILNEIRQIMHSKPLF